MKSDSDAFLFTLRNPHGVAPTMYKVTNDGNYAYYCDSYSGPVFGRWALENKGRRSSYIDTNEGNGYEYDPTYKSSLFVNTGGVSEQNYFELEDYEVYTRDKLWFF